MALALLIFFFLCSYIWIERRLTWESSANWAWVYPQKSSKSFEMIGMSKKLLGKIVSMSQKSLEKVVGLL